MKIQDIRAIAKARGIKTAKLSKADLIRTIQRNEGNNPCFAAAAGGFCDQVNCAWREDCLPAERKQAF